MNASDIEKIKWDRCDLPNERNFWKYWSEIIFPSIQRVTFTPEDLAGVTNPVLIIHGEKDRSSPYGGGRDWKEMRDRRINPLMNCNNGLWGYLIGRTFYCRPSVLE